MMRPSGGSNPACRRGSLLVEVAMAAVMLMIAMALAVKVVGVAGRERREADRRQRAILEVNNLMERITAYPFEEVMPDLARRMAPSETARRSLPDAELAVEVADQQPGPGRSAKRIAVRLRWRARGGEWDAPVRLTSWIERWRPGS